MTSLAFLFAAGWRPERSNGNALPWLLATFCLLLLLTFIMGMLGE